LVAAQIAAVVSDLGCDALKTGMLATAANVEAVCRAVREHHLPHLVVDPVMLATTGARLLEPAAQRAYRERLLPVAEVITPNLPEAEALLGRPIGTVEEMAAAARELCEGGCAAALITGGHLPGEAVDVLYERAAGHAEYLRGPRLDTPHTHGSGCVFSAALAAYLARGESLLGAARGAKEFVTRAIAGALELGAGAGAVNPLFQLSEGETEP
jgi:hydroxymethylpyrimidine kinase/phosphomethylpyrimidine kinase